MTFVNLNKVRVERRSVTGGSIVLDLPKPLSVNNLFFNVEGRGRKDRGSPRKATDEQVLAAYRETGSVWESARRLGMCGQTVHRRLMRLGAVTPMNKFADAEKRRLMEGYETHANAGTLGDLAKEMGRTKPFLCRQARALGLTTQRRSKPYLKDSAGARMKAWHATHEHPRGMLGKVHTQQTKQAISDVSTARWVAMTGDERASQVMRSMKVRAANGTLAGTRGSWKADWREIGGKRKYFRSRWEANYARYLEWLKARGEILEWEHEPETFWFETIKRGCRSYLPDFRVTENSGAVAYHEVKGWMDDRSKTKIARMGRFYPDIKLIVIDGRAYASLKRTASALVVGWEA